MQCIEESIRIIEDVKTDMAILYELPGHVKGGSTPKVWPNATASDYEMSVFADWITMNRDHLLNLDKQFETLHKFCTAEYKWSPDWSRYTMWTAVGVKGDENPEHLIQGVNRENVMISEIEPSIVAVDDGDITQQVFINIFCEDHGIKFEEKFINSPEIKRRVYEHMRRAFAFKWAFEYPRPLNYVINKIDADEYEQDTLEVVEVDADYDTDDEGLWELPPCPEDVLPTLPSPSILTPGHPSLPDGHGTNAKATVVECERQFGVPATSSLKRMAEEFTWARNALCLHWPIDGVASTAMVKHFASNSGD